MLYQAAIPDDAVSFHRYFGISRCDRDWGLFVTGNAHEVMTLIAPDSKPVAPYRHEWRSSAPGDFTIKWDPKYPEPYRFDWEKGRTFVDEFALLYFDSGAPWIFESELVPEGMTIQPGSVLLLFPDIWHRYRPELDADHPFSSTLACTFGGDIARRWQQRGLISPRNPVLYVGSDSALESGYRRMHHCAQRAESSDLQHLLAPMLMELLRRADVAARSSAPPMLSPDVIHRAKEILSDLAVSHASPRRVARLLNVPYRPFLHSFKFATGMSPHQYRLEVVIRQAKELLQDTDLSVKGIAAMLRFSDQYYFAKFFKRKTGTTPTDWRTRSHRKNSLGE